MYLIKIELEDGQGSIKLFEILKKEGEGNKYFYHDFSFGVLYDNSSDLFGDQRESMKRGQQQLAQGLFY
ncbi:hypothetical protein GCM10020331_092010 [Ectobacillus funiculus]